MAVNATQLTQLYLAYFGRPPDFDGMQYYLAQPNASIQSVAAAFSASPESLRMYGEFAASPSATIDAIYMNLFNRHAEPAGLDYWTKEVLSGRLSPAMAAYGIMIGAQNDDKVAVANKMTISTSFLQHVNTGEEILGYSGDAAASSAREFLHTVSSDALSLSAAATNIDAAVAAAVQAHASGGQTFSIAPSTLNVNEGDTVYFTLTTSGVAPGTQYAYTIVGVSSDDVAGGTLTGVATVDANGRAVIAVSTSADRLTEGVEYLKFSIAGKDSVVNVQDTSTTPVTPSPSYSVSAASDSVAEGAVETFTISTTNLAAGTPIAYTVTGTGSAAGVSLSGSAVIDASGKANVSVTLPTNMVLGDSGTLKFSLTNAAGSNTVNVSDATPTIYTMSIVDIVTSNNSNGNQPVVISVPDQGAVTINLTASTSSLYAWNGIVISGNADATINVGSSSLPQWWGNESVYATGSGSHTVNLASQTTDNVFLGAGGDTIAVGGLTMNGNQVIDAGGGTDTLSISGASDFTQGSLVGIEKVVLTSTAKFTASQLGAFSSIAASGANALEIVGGGAVDLTGKLTGVKAIVIDNWSVVTLGASDLAGVTAVTTNGGQIVTTVAGAQALLAINPAVTYSIVDTAANLATAPAAVFAGAGLVGVSQTGAAALTLDQAVAVFNANAAATFTVADTAANLYKAVVFDSYSAMLHAVNATVQVTTPATAQQALVLKGLSGAAFGVSDTMAHLVATGVGNLGTYGITVTSLTITSGTATVAQANAIAGYAATNVTGLKVSDSAANLVVAGVKQLSDAALAEATSVAITGVSSVAAVSGVKAAVGAKLASGYKVTDSAANLIAGAAITNLAGNVVANDVSIGVAVASQLETLSNAGTKSFVLVDTASNLAGAGAAVLRDASTITVQGNANVAQATAIAGFNVVSINVVDTAANVLAASAAVKAKIAGHTTISDTGVTLSVATQLRALDTSITYKVADSAALLGAVTGDANYASGAKAVLDASATVTVTGTATVTEAKSIYNANIGGSHKGSGTVAISDTVANVVANAATAAVIAAASVHATGTATVAQYGTLSGLANFDAAYSISDTAANISAFAAMGAAQIAVLNASASPVVLTGAVTVAAAHALNAATTFTNWNKVYTIVDTVANLMAAATADLTGAASVIASDNVAAINGNYPWLQAHTSGFQLVDSAVNLLANAIVAGAAQKIVVTDVSVSAVTAKALNAENPGKVVYAISDSDANLSGASLTTNSAGVANAASVTVTGGSTVAHINAIKAVNGTASLAYSISDTAANVAAGGAVTLGATTVTVTDASVSVALAASVLALVPTATFTAISDTAANIAAASSATIDAAVAVKVTDHDRVTLTVAELTKFGETAGLVGGFQTTAAGVSGNGVFYNLSDTAAKLATLTSTQIHDAGKVTIVAGGAALNAAGAQKIAGNAVSLVGSYAVADSLVNIVNGANVGGITKAGSVTVTGGSISVANAAAVTAINAASSFLISDTAANLSGVSLSANAGAIAKASAITVSTPETIANLNALKAVNGTAALTYALSDSAANLAAANASQLSGATTVAVVGNATAAQMHAIDIGRGSNVAMTVVDTATNVAQASQTELNAATSVTATGTASATDGATLAAKTYNGGASHVAYAVSDTAANIAAHPTAVSAFTTAVTVTTAATIAQAAVLATLAGGTLVYNVSDTSANLLAVDAAVLWHGTVTATDSVDVSTGERLYAVNAAVKFSVTDSAANIAAALNQTTANASPKANVDLNDMLGHATSVTVSGVGTIKLYSVAGDYVVTGSVAQLNALPAEVKAHGYVVNDTVANIVANYGMVVSGAAGKYLISDTGANITAAATTLIGGAASVVVTDTISAASAAAIYSANTASTFSVADTAANLASAGNLHATSVTATTAATVAQGTAIYAADGATASFSVSDTVANVVGGSGTNGVIKATAIVMTGNASVAQLSTVLAANGHVTSYSLSDTAAALAGATAGQLSGATAVAATTPATGAQAATIYAAAPAATYSISDTVVANLFTGDVLKASTTHATSIAGAVAGADVAQATALKNLGAQFTGSFTVTDTAANVAGAAQAVLDVATAVTMSGTVSAAQATTIAGETFGAGHTSLTGVLGAAEKDTSANVLASANAAGTANARSVEVTDTVSVATATSVVSAATYAAANAGMVFDQLSDTSTNLQIGNATAVNAAKAINVTNTLSMGLAQFMETNVGTAGASHYTFAQISDSASVVLADSATAARAAVITLTGSSSVATAEALVASTIYSKVSGGYNVADSAGNVLTAFYDQDHVIAVSGATTIAVTGTASVAQATVLEGFSNVAANTIDIQDTLAAINAAAAGVKNLAHSLTLTVNDAGANVYADTGIVPVSTLLYSNSGGFDSVAVSTVLLNGSNTDKWVSSGFDVLSLKAGDAINLHAYNVTVQGAYANAIGNGKFELIQGSVADGGTSFVKDAAGTSTLILWDADSGVGVAETGVILVGVLPTQVVAGAADATHIGLIL